MVDKTYLYLAFKVSGEVTAWVAFAKDWEQILSGKLTARGVGWQRDKNNLSCLAFLSSLALICITTNMKDLLYIVGFNCICRVNFANSFKYLRGAIIGVGDGIELNFMVARITPC